MIQLVFAHSKGIFGQGDGLPWPLIKKDFENFKMRTLGTHLVMGANTYKSLPKNLPGRHNIVIARMNDKSSIIAKNGDRPDMIIDINDIRNQLDLMKNSELTYSIIGGSQLISKSIDYVDKAFVTNIVMQWSPTIDKDTVMIDDGVLQHLHNNFIPVAVNNYVQSDGVVDRIIENELVRRKVYV